MMQSTAVTLVQTLRKHGFDAYFAGGFVRDMLLGIPSKDIDIATNALPEQVEQLFDQTYPLGKAFGVICVYEQGQVFEIATFRNDGVYEDGRRPVSVTYGTLEEDAMRRDFTMNALYYDPITEEIIDLVGGRMDIKEGVVRFIGDPDVRIQEDHVRMLRAVRLAHQIGGAYHPDTYLAIKRHAHRIVGVSAERIRDELSKMLRTPTRDKAFEDLQDLGLLFRIFPELELLKGVAQPKQYHHEGTVWEHAMQSLRSLEGEDAQNLNLLWAVLFHDIGKPETYHMDERIRFDGHAKASARVAKDVLTRFKFPARERDAIVWAVEHHMSLFHLLDPNVSLATKRQWFLDPRFDLLLGLHKADILGTTPSDLSSYEELKKERDVAVSEIGYEIPKLISGHEVADILALPHGKELGLWMKRIYEEQLAGTLKTHADVLEYLQKNKNIDLK